MILMTSIELPELRPGDFRRERLIKDICNRLDKKLILLIADPGYGKTTLLAQLVKAKNLPAVYYALVNIDSDPGTFFEHLVLGLERVDRALVIQTKKSCRLFCRNKADYRQVADTLINELVGKRCEELFILLDDYHTIGRSSKVHEIVSYLIEGFPGKTHTIIASRKMVPLKPLADWTARGDVLLVGKDDIKFTYQEVREWMKGKRGVRPDVLRDIVKMTDGWPVGIKLAVEEIQRGARRADDAILALIENERPIYEYFMKEAFRKEDTTVRNFMSKTAMLEEMEPEICEYVSGEARAGAILENLYQRSVFINRLPGGRYAYHPLFRDFLRKRAAFTGAAKEALVRAAEFYKARKEGPLAVRYFIRSGENGTGLGLMTEMLEKGDTFEAASLMKWLEGVPASVLEGYPQILVALGAAYRDCGDFDSAEAMLTKAEAQLESMTAFMRARLFYEQAVVFWRSNDQINAMRMIDRALALADRMDERQRRTVVFADIQNLCGMLYLNTGKVNRAIAHLEKAKALMSELGDTHSVRNIESNIAMYQTIHGSTVKALEIFKRCMAASRYDKSWAEIGLVAYNAVRTSLIANDLPWAARCLSQARDATQYLEDTATTASLLYAQALLHMYRGEWIEGDRCFKSALEEYRRSGWMTSQCLLLRDWARTYRYRGDRIKAEEYLGRAMEIIKDPTTPTGIGVLLERALLLVSAGNVSQAVEVAAECLGNAERHGNRITIFLSLLASAECRLFAGEKRKAVSEIQKALRLSRRYGYDGLLLLELRHRQDLAQLAIGQATGRRYLLKIDPTLVAMSKHSRKPQLYVRLFGRLAVEDQNGRDIILHWRSHKAWALFAYLLVQRDRFEASDKLMELMWPGESKVCASENLRSTVFRIKDALSRGLTAAGRLALAKSEVIVHREKGYGISPEVDIRTDVEDFDRHWNNAEASLLADDHRTAESEYTKCLVLHRGHFLEESGEPWSDEMRRAYEIKCLRALLWLAEQISAQGCHPEALRYFEQYLSMEPLDEKVHIKYWRSLKAAGRLGDIKRDWDGLVESLRRELRLKPAPETMEAYDEIFKQRPRPPAS